MYSTCPTDQFRFQTTADVKASDEIISQDRAVRAFDVGLGINKPGYNIFVTGYQGSGKTGVIQNFVDRFAKKLPIPSDWIYVYDFQKKDTPKAIRLKAGEGKKFALLMRSFIADLRVAIPSALHSEDYERTVNSIMSHSSDKQAKKYNELEKIAKKMNFELKSSTIGIETIPIIGGKILSEKEYGKLKDNEKAKIEQRRSVLEPIVLKYARKIRNIELKTKDLLRNLEKEIARKMVDAAIEPLTKASKKYIEVTEYLKQVRYYITENLSDFVNSEEILPETEQGVMLERERFQKYEVNVFIDNQKLKNAPVIFESNPTYYNLFGKIERTVEHGMYLTDFSKIRAGAIHRANGGFLILDVRDLLKNQNIWETLKKLLRNREGYIEELDEHLALIPASNLRPQPIPLDIKVIAIGSDEIYHMLFALDDEFPKIFKIKSDFDYKMDRTKENITAYVSFIASRCQKEKLLHFDSSGVAAVIEYGSRLVADQTKITTEFSKIKDLIIESDFMAREQKQKVVKRSSVERALEQKLYRANLFERNLMEMIESRDLMVSIDGKRIGQINALTVYDLGDHSFGRICRVTCGCSISNDGIFNIDRASKLSGKIHDKGMFILSSFLNSLLAREKALGISASLCFEQSYDMIDGDSATISELTAVLSSLAEIPIYQNMAMTGSLNQLGDVQPVGGINEKIEGFYQTCKILGKGKNYKVIIPYQNTSNLMLNKETRQAIAKGYLSIYPVRYFWEAFELATGVAFGARSIYDKHFEERTALSIIAKKLASIPRKGVVSSAAPTKPLRLERKSTILSAGTVKKNARLSEDSSDT